MIHYRKCVPSDLDALKALWLACFEEREDAADLFFNRNIKSCHAYVAEDRDTVVAALYLIDCTLNGIQAHYLCGAATLKSYRKRGIMSALIEYALEDAQNRGDRYSFLLPASETLYRFYAKFGYRPDCSVKTAVFETANAEDTESSGQPDLQALQKACYQNNFLLWNNSFISFAAEYYACYGVKTAASENAFAIYDAEDGFAEVLYAVFNGIKELKALLGSQGVRKFRLTGKADDPLFSDSEEETCGMIRPLGNADFPEKGIYIGITLD